MSFNIEGGLVTQQMRLMMYHSEKIMGLENTSNQTKKVESKTETIKFVQILQL